MEIWSDIEGFEGLYQISSIGRVKSLERITMRSDGRPLPMKEKILIPLTEHGGHLRVHLHKDGNCYVGRIHVLVAQAFIPNPNGCDIVHHKNESPQDNRVENLEWTTRPEHAKLHISEKDRLKKLTECTVKRSSKRVDQIDKITGEVLASYPSASEAARQFGNVTKQANISECCRGGRNEAYGFKWQYVILA